MFLDLVHIRLGILLPLTDGKDLCTFLPIDKDAQNPLGHPQELANLRHSTNIIEVIRCRVITLRITLRHDENAAVPRNRTLNGGNRTVTPHIEIDHHMRIDHQTAQREQREGLFLGHRISFHLSILKRIFSYEKRSTAVQSPFRKLSC